MEARDSYILVLRLEMPWEVLALFGMVPDQMIKVLRQFDNGVRSCVRLNGGEFSEWVNVEQGLH